MKLLTVLTLLFFFPSLGKADCNGAVTSWWPNGKTLGKNPIIILSTGDSAFAKNVGAGNLLYLKSKNGIVQLGIIETCTGGLNLIQLILKPKTELVAGEKYGLFYANSTKKFKPIKKWDSELQDKVLIEWEVSNSTAMDLPLWKKEPSITAKFYRENGCGPDEWVYFDFAAVGNQVISLKAVVKNMKTGKVITCYMSQKNEKFQLGHNMCYGECEFGEGNKYEVVFYLLNESGNLSKASKPIKFTKPETEGWSN